MKWQKPIGFSSLSICVCVKLPSAIVRSPAQSCKNTSTGSGPGFVLGMVVFRLESSGDTWSPWRAALPTRSVSKVSEVMTS